MKSLIFAVKFIPINLLIIFDKNEIKLNSKNHNLFVNKIIEINKILRSQKIIIKGLDEVIYILKKQKFHSTSNLRYFKSNFGRELFYISLIKNL